jgi:hypothetical protein
MRPLAATNSSGGDPESPDLRDAMTFPPFIDNRMPKGAGFDQHSRSLPGLFGNLNHLLDFDKPESLQ